MLKPSLRIRSGTSVKPNENNLLVPTTSPHTRKLPNRILALKYLPFTGGGARSGPSVALRKLPAVASKTDLAPTIPKCDYAKVLPRLDHPPSSYENSPVSEDVARGLMCVEAYNNDRRNN